MPRIRTVKPEFWEDEVVGALPREARLMLIACFNLADDEGILRWVPEYLKASVFIYDEDVTLEMVQEWMKAIESSGMVFAYRGGNTKQSLALIVNFRKHQQINRPQPGKLPAPNIQSDEVRQLIFRRDKFICHLCLHPIPEDISAHESIRPSIDHVIPVSKGGGNHPANLRAAHTGCNKARGAKEIAEFSMPERTKEILTHYFTRKGVPYSVPDSLNDSVTEGKRKGREEEEGREEFTPALPSEELNPTEAAQGVINGLAMTHRGPKGTDALLSITAAIEARQKVGKWKPCEIADQMISMRQKFLKSVPATEDYGALWFLTKDGFFWTDPSRWPKAQSTPPSTQPESRRRTGAEVTLRQILGDPSLDPSQAPKLEADLRKVLRRDGVPEIENIIIELRNERERLKAQRPN